MDHERFGKIWTRVQMIVLVPVAFASVALTIMDVFSPAAATQPGMPWGQFAAILVPILVIFAVYFFLQYKKSPQSPPAETLKPYALPYSMSSDMRWLAKYGILIALIPSCIFLPRKVMELSDGVGTREWFSDACILLILVMCIPTWVQWALMLWKKEPEVA